MTREETTLGAAAKLLKRYAGRDVATLLDDDVQALRDYLSVVLRIAIRMERERELDSNDSASCDSIEK